MHTMVNQEVETLVELLQQSGNCKVKEALLAVLDHHSSLDIKQRILESETDSTSEESVVQEEKRTSETRPRRLNRSFSAHSECGQRSLSHSRHGKSRRARHQRDEDSASEESAVQEDKCAPAPRQRRLIRSVSTRTECRQRSLSRSRQGRSRRARQQREDATARRRLSGAQPVAARRPRASSIDALELDDPKSTDLALRNGWGHQSWDGTSTQVGLDRHPQRSATYDRDPIDDLIALDADNTNSTEDTHEDTSEPLAGQEGEGAADTSEAIVGQGRRNSLEMSRHRRSRKQKGRKVPSSPNQEAKSHGRNSCSPPPRRTRPTNGGSRKPRSSEDLLGLAKSDHHTKRSEGFAAFRERYNISSSTHGYPRKPKPAHARNGGSSSRQNDAWSKETLGKVNTSDSVKQVGPLPPLTPKIDQEKFHESQFFQFEPDCEELVTTKKQPTVKVNELIDELHASSQDPLIIEEEEEAAAKKPATRQKEEEAAAKKPGTRQKVQAAFSFILHRQSSMYMHSEAGSDDESFS